MKNKTTILLVTVLLVISTLTFALAQDSANLRGKMMEKRMIDDFSERPAKPMMHQMHLMGSGLAVNPSDSTDFTEIHIVAGRIALPNGSIISRGLVKLGDEKYKLSNIVVTDGSATADVYNNDKSLIGTLKLSQGERRGRAVWHGTLKVNDQTWNIYILSLHRGFLKEEIADKVRDYCKENPEDENCNSVAGYVCRNNPRECKDKVRDFCNDHKDDARCKNLVRGYCSENSGDDRCKASDDETESSIDDDDETESSIGDDETESSVDDNSIELKGTIDYEGLPDPGVIAVEGWRYFFIADDKYKAELVRAGANLNNEIVLVDLEGNKLSPSLEQKYVEIDAIFIKDYPQYKLDLGLAITSADPTGQVLLLENDGLELDDSDGRK